MKTGKYIPLGEYENIKIGYGTIDFIDLKTIYLKFNTWIQPVNDDDNYDDLIKKTRKKIKDHIYTLNSEYFKPLCIVDLDIKSRGLKTEKRSFMNLEITLYVSKFIDVKSKTSKSLFKGIQQDVIKNCLDNKTLFNFNKNKKIS